MRITLFFIFLTMLLSFSLQEGIAQFRSDYSSIYDRTGQVVRTETPDNQRLFSGFENFTMNHSYEMTLGSFGGDMYNLNTYTNTMRLRLSENLYGRLDLSMSHSPLGSNLMGQDNNMQFYVRNAELKYKFNEKTRIQVRFQQLPGVHPFGYGYSPYDQRRSPFYDPAHSW